MSSERKILALAGMGTLVLLGFWLGRSEQVRAPVPPPALVLFQASLREEVELYRVDERLNLVAAPASSDEVLLGTSRHLVVERPGESEAFRLPDLIPDNFKNYARNSRAGEKLTVVPVLFGWTPARDELWGALELHPEGDPSAPKLAALFRIRPPDWKMEKFDLASDGGYLRLGTFNLRNKGILFEDMTDGLKLFAFYPEFGLRMPVAAYGRDLFGARCGREKPFLNYYHQGGAAGLGCDADRDLKAHWTIAGAGYLDFLTREPRLKEFAL